MQSPITTAIRAFTMLACLVVITAVAMHGSSWSSIVEKFKKIDLSSVLPSPSGSPSAENEKARHLASINSPTQHRMAESPKSRPEPSIPAPPVDMPAPTTAQQVDQVGYQDVQGRLQSLGATYYLLESWGNRQELYRFQCRVAVGKNTDYTHYFEATDADPLQAMLQVLRQVESWREG